METDFFNKYIDEVLRVDITKLALLSKLGCNTVRDLMFHAPLRTIDRSYTPALQQVKNGEMISQIVTVESCKISSRYRKTFRKAPSKIYCSNDTGSITLIYFNNIPAFVIKRFIPGNEIFISGKVDVVSGELQMVHPNIVALAKDKDRFGQPEPVYPLISGITSKYLSTLIKNILSRLPMLEEWLPNSIIDKYGWENFNKSLHNIHSSSKNALTKKSKERLAFDEILAQQISIQLIKKKVKRQYKEPVKSEKKLVNKLIDSLPFSLTKDQLNAIDEIMADQMSSQRMTRLLIGDVGCGKTIVALCAILNVIESGKQAVFMVPTELLAVQHFTNIQKLLSAEFGIVIELLVGNIRKSEREQILENLKDGSIDLVIGTQALFQEKVRYKNIALAVVDEQHRFGVNQRLALIEKGMDCDLLMLSATPIPRTFYMVSYGDMDLTCIKEKPHKDSVIKTSVLSKNKIPELVGKIQNVLSQGEKIYWICPLIQESEKLQLSFVEERYEHLKKELGEVVGMVHGQISQEERSEMMQKFIEGEIKVLVSTTVIEVGVDVSDATIMIIENAERFGLAQLHQLRGRVGRGTRDSYCILLYDDNLSFTSKKRLNVIRKFNDGFYIAEHDMKNRGSGDVAGVKQSGLPYFKIFNFYDYKHLLQDANILASQMIDSEDHEILLDLFDRQHFTNAFSSKMT